MKALCKTSARWCPRTSSRAAASARSRTSIQADGNVGGAWTPDTARLADRPARHARSRSSGPASTAKDATARRSSSCRPTIDKECLPATAKESRLLSFTALHEVGHGVDDSTAYMQRNGGKPDHGGWVRARRRACSRSPTWSGPHIFKAGAATPSIPSPRTGSTCSTSCSTRSRPTDVGGAAGSDDAKAYDDFDDWHKLATSDGDLGAARANARTITIGGKTIYHEAYPREWVSYDAGGAQARASPATSSAPPANGSPSSMPATRRTSSASSIRPVDWLKKL